jgi:hypothetical protein
MSWSRFDDDCPGCKPSLINMKTGKPYKDDSLLMQAILEMWNTTTLEERKAWHDVCCYRPGSTDKPPTPEQIKLAQGLASRMSVIAKSIIETESQKPN